MSALLLENNKRNNKAEKHDSGAQEALARPDTVYFQSGNRSVFWSAYKFYHGHRDPALALLYCKINLRKLINWQNRKLSHNWYKNLWFIVLDSRNVSKPSDSWLLWSVSQGETLKEWFCINIYGIFLYICCLSDSF